jgi:phosphoribosylglycinamide formyltransferase 2
VRGHRRMGVSLALGSTIDEARAKARAMTEALLKGVRCE